MKLIRGFTLIELMIVIAVIAIIAAVAYPSYTGYVKRNTESTMTSTMLNIASQSEKWRAKALSYKGFQPEQACKQVHSNPSDNTSALVQDCSDTTFCMPSANDCRYDITLRDGGDTSKGLGVNSVSGISWAIFAEPHSGSTYDGETRKFLLLSSGERCQVESTDSGYGSFSISSNCSGASQW